MPLDGSVEDVVAGWVGHEMSPWPEQRLSAVAVRDGLDRLNATNYTVFLFDLSAAGVSVRAKPLWDGHNPAHRVAIDHRVGLHKDFIARVIARHGIAAPTTIAIDVGDESPDYGLPVFSFQKKRGTSIILLPDMIVDYAFYADGPHTPLPDATAYADKAASAVFVGSTTGAGVITEAMARGDDVPRIRSARFFRDKPGVDFRLPGIVQCVSPQVEALLRDEGFGGASISYEDQLEHKFMISMDGNGATCSRVYVALASNCVLLKYASRHDLFYFASLEAARHYVPIERDEDVLAVLRDEESSPGRFAEIARESRAFAEKLLSRDAIELYTARLLQAYADRRPSRESAMTIRESLGTAYTAFIPQICELREAKKYLEVGVHAGGTLANVKVQTAIGVDPMFRFSEDPTKGKTSLQLFQMTSDAFFATHKIAGVDLAFLDGMHLFEYLLRDFYNTEAVSTPGGLIMMHDCLPLNVAMIARVDTRDAWTGDVWKIVPILKKYRPDLRVVALDCAPTGLVCVSSLDPGSTLLKEHYFGIVEEAMAMPNDQSGLDALYADIEIVNAQNVLIDFNHTRYFRR